MRALNPVNRPAAKASGPKALASDVPAQASAPSAASASQATIALLQAHSLTSVVHVEIERLILDGELAPGAKLTEAGLAERLGVSRGPIREALRVLEEAGLVRQEKNRGAFVRHIAVDEAVEIYELRAMLEESAGRHLAQHITPEQLKALRTLVEQMERLVREGHNSSASDQYHRLNLGFHEALIDQVGNRKLSTLYRRLVKELSLLRRANLAGGQQIPVSVSEHRAILKAIAAGQAEAAGAALRAHVLESRDRMLRQPAVQAQAGSSTPRSTPEPAATAAAEPAPTRKSRHA